MSGSCGLGVLGYWVSVGVCVVRFAQAKSSSSRSTTRAIGVMPRRSAAMPSVDEPLVRIFTLNRAEADGLLWFYYEHENRTPVLVQIDVVQKEVRYTSASGIATPFHGHCCERMQYDKEYGHVCHQIQLQDFHSPFGILTNQIVTQCGPHCWKGRHPRNREIIRMTRIRPIVHERVQVPLDDGAIPLEDKPSDDVYIV